MRTEVTGHCAQPRIRGVASGVLVRSRDAWQALSARSFWLSHWCWPLTIAVALIYVVCFAGFIRRHTALPFWDGYVYVQKTRNLAEKFHRASFVERLNPALYLKEMQPERPPLLIAAAAIVLGPNPGNAAIAYVWMTVRVVVILLALFLLSRQLGTSWFVPAAALVIFGSPLMCDFYRLHMMDEPFAAFGLLAFALMLIDDRRQTMGSALAASAGILALFLVKPVAPAFVLPWCIVRGIRALFPLRHQPVILRPLIMWAIPYVSLLGVMLALLYASPYGPGIREQYNLGLTGYWNTEVTFQQARRFSALMLPPWLLLAAIPVVRFWRTFQQKPMLLYLAGGLVWWVVFSFFLTYAVQDRLLGQAMPYAVTGLLVWLCQRPAIALVVTLAAGFFFTYNTLAANGGMKVRYDSNTYKMVKFLSPVPGHQRPVPEVGLISFARQLNAALSDEKPKNVRGVFNDTHVEPNAVNMALHLSTGAQDVRVQWVPADPLAFNVRKFCRQRWFVTKTRRPVPGSGHTGLWTTIQSAHALITDAASPLHSYFQKVFEVPIRQPDLEDTLVLWHLPSLPPDSVIADSLRWLKPRLTNDPPAFSAAIDSQFQAILKGTSGTRSP